MDAREIRVRADLEPIEMSPASPALDVRDRNIVFAAGGDAIGEDWPASGVRDRARGKGRPLRIHQIDFPTQFRA